MIKKNIIITGGSGYIGSALAVASTKNYNVITIDKKTKNYFIKNQKIKHFKCNLNNITKIKQIIKSINPDIIVHLAAQSTLDFISIKKNSYLKDNLIATNNLVKITRDLNIKKFIFSSTASVYKQKSQPISEMSNLLPNNIYGKTKLRNEKFIKKTFKMSKTKYCILRFFNVCSSLKKNFIGEFHSPETHLLPKVVNALINRNHISVFGNNYSSKDGTCIRDYIHIKDIVSGILKSINYLEKNQSNTFNLGSGRSYSVMDIIKKCSKQISVKPKIIIEKPRNLDVSKLVCKINKAKKLLNWNPINSNISKIISDEIWWFKFLKKKKYLRTFYNLKK